MQSISPAKRMLTLCSALVLISPETRNANAIQGQASGNLFASGSSFIFRAICTSTENIALLDSWVTMRYQPAHDQGSCKGSSMTLLQRALMPLRAWRMDVLMTLCTLNQNFEASEDRSSSCLMWRAGIGRAAAKITEQPTRRPGRGPPEVVPPRQELQRGQGREKADQHAAMAKQLQVGHDPLAAALSAVCLMVELCHEHVQSGLPYLKTCHRWLTCRWDLCNDTSFTRV